MFFSSVSLALIWARPAAPAPASGRQAGQAALWLRIPVQVGQAAMTAEEQRERRRVLGALGIESFEAVLQARPCGGPASQPAPPQPVPAPCSSAAGRRNSRSPALSCMPLTPAGPRRGSSAPRGNDHLPNEHHALLQPGLPALPRGVVAQVRQPWRARQQRPAPSRSLSFLNSLRTLPFLSEPARRRTEFMPTDVIDRCLELMAASPSLKTLDITGGAPEYHPEFR